MQYIIERTGDALGDHCMAVFFTKILIDNGFDAKFRHSIKKYNQLFDIPSSEESPNFRFDYSSNDNPVNPSFDKDKNIIYFVIEKFKTKFNIEKEIKIINNFCPVNYTDIPAIENHDVTLNGKTGGWTPYTRYPTPKFLKLKSLLDKEGISFYDLAETKNNETLNYVKKSKVFVGLQTGVSIFVSQVVNKGLIIQSGYSTNEYWNCYGLDYISKDYDCKECFLHKRKIKQGKLCPHEHRCMQTLEPEDIVKKIKEKL